MLDLTAFAALIKRKRGEKRLTQETLAQDVFGDSTRKGDISRIENAKVQPQEATIQKLCAALGISNAELDPIRTARASARQLNDIPTLSRDELELLAGRFDAQGAHSQTDADLRSFLTLKAEEYRLYRAQIEGIDERTAGLGNLKAAARDAAERLDLAEVETLLSRVHEVEVEIAAETAELRARNALLRGRVEQAYTLLSAAADSFLPVDPVEPISRRTKYGEQLRLHGLRFGGSALEHAARILRTATKTELSANNTNHPGF